MKQCQDPCPCSGPRITKNGFRISVQPDWHVNNVIFNKPIMVHIQIMVTQLGALNREFVSDL